MPLFSQPTQAEFMASVSGLGIGDFDPQVSPRANAEWASMIEKYQEAQYYFYGDIFTKRADPATTDSPLMYPIKLNLVRMMCLTQAAALWGQWEDDLLTFQCPPESEAEEAKKRAEAARVLISETYEASGGQILLYEGGLAQQIYGGTFLRAAIDPSKPHGVRIDKLMPYNVFVRWDPITINRILEAFIAIPIDKAEAALAYGFTEDSLPDEVVYLEHWTEQKYETSIGGHVLSQFSGINPWKFVPLVYIPRVRLEGFYGLSLADDIMGVQDELNARLADVGDNINNSAHSIRWIRNYRGDPSRDFETGPDAMWDLGQTIAGQDKPEVGTLEGQAEPHSTFSFINFLLDMTRQAAFTSPVAFGQDEGSQRSGVTLTLRLWPLLQQVKTTRIYWRTQLVDLHRKILVMAKTRDIENRYSGKLTGYTVMPNFFDLVPQDRELLIDEVTQRAAQNLISPEEAVARFGVKAGTEQDEVNRIRAWLKYQSDLKAEEMKAQAEVRQQQFGGPGGRAQEQNQDQ
jgi:hypothetical protein